jgi:hypothetical protein
MVLGRLPCKLQGLQHRLVEGFETRLLDGIHSRTLRLGSRDEHGHPGIRGRGEYVRNLQRSAFRSASAHADRDDREEHEQRPEAS